MQLIMGLGNPGKQYQFTRHNIGFRILEEFAFRNMGTETKWKKRFFSQIIQSHFNHQKILLAKPQTFMNVSGKAASEIMKYYGIANQNLLVIYDDIHLPLGSIRIRKSGSAGGHRGMASIIEHLNSQAFPRLRIGIKNDQLLHYMDFPSFVLSSFLPEEEKLLKNTIQRATKALGDIMSYGYEYAMREYNQIEEKPHHEEKI